MEGSFVGSDRTWTQRNTADRTNLMMDRCGWNVSDSSTKSVFFKP